MKPQRRSRPAFAALALALSLNTLQATPPADPTPRLREEGRQHRLEGNTEAAIQTYTALLAAAPEDAQARHLLALLLWQQAQTAPPATAYTLLTQARTLTPDDPLILNAYVIAATNARDWHNAAQALHRLTLADPTITNAAPLLPTRLRILAGLGAPALATRLAQDQADRLPATLITDLQTDLATARAAWATADGNRGLLTRPPKSDIPGAPGCLALAYHCDRLTADQATQTASLLLQHLDFLTAQGFTFVSIRDVAAARTTTTTTTTTPLPPRSILLTFDGAHPLIETTILPIISLYDAPALIAIDTDAIGTTRPPYNNPDIMDRTALARLAQHPRVTIATRGHKLAQRLPSNPQGDAAPAAITRRYRPSQKNYESEAEQAARLRGDLTAAILTLRSQGIAGGDILVWPEGACNPPALEQARAAGIGIMLGRAPLPPLPGHPLIPRTLVPPATDLSAFLPLIFPEPTATNRPTPSFGLPVSLDRLYDPADEATTRRNLATMLDQVRQAGATTVYLDAFSDLDHNGAAEAVYFPNRVLPVRADLLNHTIHLLQQANIKVLIRMPVLGLTLPNERWRDRTRYVTEFRWARFSPQDRLAPRLSPFNEENRANIIACFTDLAAHAPADGLVLMNDLFLTPYEDFGNDAAKVHFQQLGLRERNPERFTPEERHQWEQLKYTQLQSLADTLQAVFKRQNPGALTIRELTTAAVGNRDARALFSQDAADTLGTFDRLLVEITPDPQGIGDADAWLRSLTGRAGQDLDRMIFRLDLRPNLRGVRPPRGTWERRAGLLAREGVRHFTFTAPPDGSIAAPQILHRLWSQLRKQIGD